nr:hypothetical protein CFP56_53578 [Quercus suber]
MPDFPTVTISFQARKKNKERACLAVTDAIDSRAAEQPPIVFQTAILVQEGAKAQPPSEHGNAADDLEAAVGDAVAGYCTSSTTVICSMSPAISEQHPRCIQCHGEQLTLDPIPTVPNASIVAHFVNEYVMVKHGMTAHVRCLTNARAHFVQAPGAGLAGTGSRCPCPICYQIPAGPLRIPAGQRVRQQPGQGCFRGSAPDLASSSLARVACHPTEEQACVP